MRFAMHIAITNWAGGALRLGPTLAQAVEAAEAAGFDAISVADHVWGSQYTGGVEASQIEAYTTLGFIAAHTRRVRLLALATAVPYRHPGLLVAKYADACNIRPGPEIPRQFDLLKRLCDEAGRDYGAIEKTAPFFFDVGDNGDPSKIAELLGKLRWLAGMGIETVFGWVVGVDQIAPIEIMGREVIPAAAEL